MGVGIEGLNPSRRYRGFRPRQAARGRNSNNATSNNPTYSLFNNSSAVVLCVRDFCVGNTNGSNVNKLGTLMTQGTIGTAGGVVQPLFPGDGAPAGQLFFLDDSTDRSGSWDYTPMPMTLPGDAVLAWYHDFPFAVVPPGWSFVVQFQNTNASMFSILWESISVDELDYFY